MEPATARCLRTDTDGTLTDRFNDFLTSDRFPCVGAKAALNRGQIETVVEADLRCKPTASAVRALQHFSQAYRVDAPLFRSFAILFRNPRYTDEQDFESDLWRYLQNLHYMDRSQYPWDASVSRDATSPQFSFSVGGRAYYVVGLHPGASRRARRFESPALVFNLHDQFERLRADGRYESIRDTIVERDLKMNGSRNPMLKPFGARSEACQYSGRVVDQQWKCPFHAK